MRKNKFGWFIALVISFVVMLGFDTFAMTVESVENVQPSETGLQKKETVVYLLSWQDNKIVTTQGTFYLSTDIAVINQSGLEQEDIVLQERPPIVQIDKVGRQIQTVTIQPNVQ